MWKEVEKRTLSSGVVSIAGNLQSMIIGAASSRKWRLDRFKSVSVRVSDQEAVLGLQFFKNGDGEHRIRPGRATVVVHCGAELRGLNALPKRRYIGKRSTDGFVTVSLENPLPPGFKFTNREKSHRAKD